jgi:AcrR family transcriptional regulator
MTEPRPKRGPGRPPAAKATETRKRIIGVAREVFGEVGYDATTFQAIAVRADLTRPAINHYFPSKKVLYRSVVEDTNDLVITGAMERARQETTLIGRLSAFIGIAVQADSPDRSVAAFMVTAMLESQRHPELRLIDHGSLLSSRDFLTWAVSDAIERGEISTDAQVSPLVELLIAMVWGMGFYAGFVGSQQELAVLIKNLRHLLGNELWRIRD